MDDEWVCTLRTKLANYNIQVPQEVWQAIKTYHYSCLARETAIRDLAQQLEQSGLRRVGEIIWAHAEGVDVEVN
jgi:hypothetical protein